MNSMNDERFFDLAMKVLARQGTDAERAELDALLAREPELKAEFERLRAEVGVAKEALPLVNASEATTGELPAYARVRLQTKVRQTLGRPQPGDDAKRERERNTICSRLRPFSKIRLGLFERVGKVVLHRKCFGELL